MKQFNLEIRWSISRGRDTHGYNICTLWDYNQPYRTLGGGYDMTGTVFAQWLKANYLPLIVEKLGSNMKDGNHPDYYGFSFYGLKNSYHLDGACGLDCMVTIAKAIGLEVKYIYGKKRLTNLWVQEVN